MPLHDLRDNKFLSGILSTVDLIAGESIRRGNILRQQKNRRQTQKLGLLQGIQNLDEEGTKEVFNLQREIIADPDFAIGEDFGPGKKKFNIPPAVSERLGLKAGEGKDVNIETFKQLTPSGLLSKLGEPQETQVELSEFVGKNLGLTGKLPIGDALEAERAATGRFSALKPSTAGQKTPEFTFSMSDGTKVTGKQANQMVEFLDQQLQASAKLIEKSKLADELTFDKDGKIKGFTKKKVGGNVREIAKMFNRILEIKGKMVRGVQLSEGDEQLLFGGKGVFQPESQGATDANQKLFEALDAMQQRVNNLQ